MVGGFMGAGSPKALIDALVQSGVKNLTLIGNDTDFEGQGVGKLIANNQISKISASHIGTNPQTGDI